MNVSCPHCSQTRSKSSEIVRMGYYFRKSDSRHLIRYRCKRCFKSFSQATFSECYGQKRRRLNEPLFKLLVSGVSQRRAAFILGCNLKTVARKLRFLSERSKKRVIASNQLYPKVLNVQFDDVETFEHTKCKPLSITIAVESHSRRILGFQVRQIGAKGHLAKIARKKYPPRPSNRSMMRDKLFMNLQGYVHPKALFESDKDPYYPQTVRKFFPLSEHKTTLGRRGCVTGQGELKRGGYDPLFWLNHTAAELRANINRLFRRTWCTTKKPQGLIDHLWLYVEFHNNYKAKYSSA